MILPLLVGLTILTGCGSERSSAPAEQAAPTAAGSTPASPPVGFGANPVDVEMINQTENEIELECRLPSQNLVIPVGESVNFTGDATSGADVWCTPYVLSNSMGEASFDVTIKNPTVGRPDVTVHTSKHTFSEGDSWTANYNFVNIDVKRLDDTADGHKSFVITYRL